MFVAADAMDRANVYNDTTCWYTEQENDSSNTITLADSIFSDSLIIAGSGFVAHDVILTCDWPER